MPVAMTTRVMALLFFLFKILNLVGRNIYVLFLPGIGRKAGFHTKVRQKLFGLRQLIPYLGQKSGIFGKPPKVAKNAVGTLLDALFSYQTLVWSLLASPKQVWCLGEGWELHTTKICAKSKKKERLKNGRILTE